MNGRSGAPAGTAPYDWGASSANDAMARARGAGITSPMWWLDVEFGNTWPADKVANAQVVQGVIDGVRASGANVGVYSTSYQWNAIVGGFAPRVPVWVACATWATASSWR